MRIEISVGLCLLAALSWADAGESVISAVSVDEATVGTEFDIVGSGFGARPHVELTLDQETSRTERVKVIAITTDSNGTQTVAVRIVRATAGTYRISVTPRGRSGVPAFAEHELSIVPPEIIAVSPGSAFAGGDIALGVRAAGSRGGTVLVAGRKAKITSREPHFSDPEVTVIRARVARSTPDGRWEVTFQNAIGSATAHQSLTIAGGTDVPLGARRLDAVIDGVPFSARSRAKLSLKPSPQGLVAATLGGRLHVGAHSSQRGATTELALVTPFDIASEAAPAVVRDDRSVLALTETDKDGAVTVWEASSSDDVTVFVNATNVERQRVAGSFVGTLRRVSGSAQPPIRRVDGRFLIDPSPDPICSYYEALWCYVGTDRFATIRDTWVVDGIDPLHVATDGVGRYSNVKSLRKRLRAPDHFDVELEHDFDLGPATLLDTAGEVSRFDYRTFAGETYFATADASGRSSVVIEVGDWLVQGRRVSRFAGALRAADGRTKIVCGLFCLQEDD